uniref:Sorting nexin/Vps5-like C-terminal domain-containing protein n=1 Tax=Lotharella globosa TaxID=91324 RepID=A0A7S3YJH8_9EUKA
MKVKFLFVIQAKKLHKILAALHAASSGQSKAEKDVTKTWLEMGHYLTELGRFEVDSSEEHFGGILAQIGKCCDRMSVCSAQCVDHSVLHLVEPLKDHVLLVESVSTMMANRKKALENLHIAQKDQSKKKAALKNLEGKGSKLADAKKAEQDSTKLVEERQNALDEMTKSVIEEIANFRREKKKDFKRMFEGFVKMRIEQAKRQQEAWESVLGDMQLESL